MAIGVKVEAAEEAERLIRLSTTGQVAEKNFMLRPDQAHLATAQSLVAEAKKAVASLDSLLERQAARDSARMVGEHFDVWLTSLREYAGRETEKTRAEQGTCRGTPPADGSFKEAVRSPRARPCLAVPYLVFMPLKTTRFAWR